MKSKIRVSALKPNEENPRFIDESKFEKLIKSIKEFPQMLEIRPLVIDENFVVLGGNMRLRAIQELGIEEVSVIQVDDWDPERKKEFIIQDNVSFGKWDWDVLGNEWQSEVLNEWGMDVWTPTSMEDLEDFFTENEEDKKEDESKDHEKWLTAFVEYVKKNHIDVYQMAKSSADESVKL